jgi:GNAT superfamily N-acetyltransferase
MPTTFERATPVDAEALLQAQIRAFHDDARLYPGVELGGPPGYDSLETVLKKMQQEEYFTVRYDGQIVGGIVVEVKGEGHCHLDILFVDPDYHNLGIGSQAMQFLYKTYDATKWTLDTPLYAVRNQHFYEKFGFVKVGQWDEEGAEGITLIAYEMNL